MPDQPNLLLIWTDEQRRDTMSCYGNDYVRAPNLNRLAAQSQVFRHAYCVQPVCTPSRGSIMTGLWPHQHGAVRNNAPLHRDARTIAELVSDDYRCAYVGKWHLGDEIIAQHGFDEWHAIEDSAYRAYFSKPEYLEQFSAYHHFLRDHGFPPDSRAKDGAYCYSRGFSAAMAAQYSKAHFVGRKTAQLIREHDHSRPFLLSANMLEPHMPFFGPYNDWYDPAEVPVGPAFNKPPGADASVRHRAMSAIYRGYGHHGLPLKSDGDWRRWRANYLGLVSMVDEAVGFMLEALDQSGLADNTIVVFTSDHGEMMGDHALLAKGVLYEESVGIPWLLRIPGVGNAGRIIDGRVSQIDLVPTLLDLMGQPLPDHLEGRSLAPVLRGDETLDDNDVFFIWRGDDYRAPAELAGFSDAEKQSLGRALWRCIVSADGWKLNLTTMDRCELYDLNDDPHEMTNRIDDPSQRERIRDLTSRIRTWQKRVGDDAPLPAFD